MNCLKACLSQSIQAKDCGAYCRGVVEDNSVVPILVGFRAPSLSNLFVGVIPSIHGRALQPIPPSGLLVVSLLSTGTRSIMVSRSASTEDLVALVPLHLALSPDKTRVNLTLGAYAPISDRYSVAVAPLPPTSVPRSQLLGCPLGIGLKPSANWSSPGGTEIEGYPKWKWLVFGLSLGLALVLLGACVGGYLHTRKDRQESSGLVGFEESLRLSRARAISRQP
jgi:hypothetical protein